MDSTLKQLRQVIASLVETPELQGIRDCNRELRDAIPPGDHSDFLADALPGFPESVQVAVLKAMAFRGHPEAAPFARGLVGDPDIIVRLDAAVALVTLGEAAGRSVIEAIASDPGYRQDAMEVLAEFRSLKSDPWVEALYERLLAVSTIAKE